MAYKPPVRNFDRVQFEEIRRSLDKRFNDAHDGLTAAYYDHWRNGRSRPWQGYDVQPTNDESKALFDKLHGLIFLLRDVAFHDANMSLPEAERYSEDAYRYDRDEQGQITRDRLQESQDSIERLRVEGIEVTIAETGE